MRNLDELEYHPISERVVEALRNKTQSSNSLFFRVLIGYYFAKIASMQRTNIKTHDRGIIPINMYALNLATSGQGKGHSTNIVEEQIINQFKERFLEETFQLIAEENQAKLAVKRATKKQCDPDEELARVQKEFESLGALAFSFDSGTPAAVKQMRHKLLMANAGSMNMEIDEIGSNLMGQVDVLNTFLELFDVGKIKQKLTKNTNENTRSEEIDGKTPTNMMLFGTPSKLLSGGKTEEEFYSMLETGYARRCIFGYSRDNHRATEMSPEQIYAMLTDTTTDTFLEDLSDDLGALADPVNFNKSLILSKDSSILVIRYRLHCEEKANAMAEHEDIRKAEMSHRYFKMLKLAGAYAFVDGSHEVTEDHIYNAIKLVEESGGAFERLLTREGSYVKLAKYIATAGHELTHVDLVEALPFYKGSESQKREMLTMATAYGYKNNIIIKRMFTDGIEFLQGESLEETNLDKMILSWSTHEAYQYFNQEAPYDKLHKLFGAQGLHWANHHAVGGYENPPRGHRTEDTMIRGFNMVVIDVDDGVSLATAKLLLKDYKCIFYTTKRHQTPGHGDRFRIIMPINYKLKLDAADFKEFMNNIYEWLPFSVDDGTDQRSRKWMSNNTAVEYNDGILLDALSFIPKTSKNEERKSIISTQQQLTNVERWFVNNTGIGNRSKQLIRYALMLVDSGQDLASVQTNVMAFNNKLQDKLPEAEIAATIMQTVTKAILRRNSA